MDRLFAKKMWNGIQRNLKKAKIWFEEYVDLDFYALPKYQAIQEADDLELAAGKVPKRAAATEQEGNVTYELHRLALNEAYDLLHHAFSLLEKSARCGNPYALYECAKMMAARNPDEYRNAYPRSPYPYSIVEREDYDPERAGYYLRKAKQYTGDKRLAAKIKRLETEVSTKIASGDVCIKDERMKMHYLRLVKDYTIDEELANEIWQIEKRLDGFAELLRAENPEAARNYEDVQHSTEEGFRNQEKNIPELAMYYLRKARQHAEDEASAAEIAQLEARFLQKL